MFPKIKPSGGLCDFSNLDKAEIDFERYESRIQM